MHDSGLSADSFLCNLPLTIEEFETMEEEMKFHAIISILVPFFCNVAFGQEGLSELASVRLSYESLSERAIDGANAEIGSDQWEIRAPFFYKESGDWKIAAGVRYQSTRLEVSDANLIDEDRLHSLDLAIFLSKSQSDSLDWLFLLNPNLAGDFENLG